MLPIDPAPPRGERRLFFPGKTVPLRAMLGALGRWRVDTADYNWHGLKRGRAEFCLLQYTLAGRGRLRVGAIEREVTPGMAMLLHFPDDNQYWLPADSPSWEFLYVCLHGREVLRLWHRIEVRLGPLAAFSPTAGPVTCAARIVDAALAGSVGDPFAASTLAYGLLMSLAAEVRVPRGAAQNEAALERARRHAEQHLHEPLTVEAMARQAGLSRYHFSRLFAAHTGMAPAAWLTDQRVRAAARLLRDTRLPLKEIAPRCGFPNANYLGRVFRRHAGMPPASYRRSGI